MERVGGVAHLESARLDSALGRPLKLCLAASGGGHIRQLLDIEAVWAPLDYFFITEDTALGRSLAEKHRTHFIPHVALGQARLGSPVKMVLAAVRNLFRSARILAKERPDVLISTGAGAVFFAVLFGRLLGARTVIVDSFARFHKPSVFARLAAPLAHELVVQSAALKAYLPRARVFDPLRMLATPPPAKKPLLLATVGATLPFDRLVRSVAQLKAEGRLPEEVIVQCGIGGYQPPGLQSHETLPFDRIQSLLEEADIVVCHGGTGSMITALRQGCRVVAMPRRFGLREHYDDHQAEITDAFADRGLVGTADTVEELAAALDLVRARAPVVATTDQSELSAFLNGVVASQAARKGLRLGVSPALP